MDYKQAVEALNPLISKAQEIAVARLKFRYIPSPEALGTRQNSESITVVLTDCLDHVFTETVSLEEIDEELQADMLSAFMSTDYGRA